MCTRATNKLRVICWADICIWIYLKVCYGGIMNGTIKMNGTMEVMPQIKQIANQFEATNHTINTKKDLLHGTVAARDVFWRYIICMQSWPERDATTYWEVTHRCNVDNNIIKRIGRDQRWDENQRIRKCIGMTSHAWIHKVGLV
ncbi:hypothetical protein L1987_30955 [Smallanthus sonchifolius]|uniref:Uncharacterized protein n=1 Tax=Smallanthus sonchifolius TaxID=185202 RepID=A0ACB9I6Z1_9ASTR|nr:hypothetical protein L1987_30955 [Smallanthus sonchifolius]